MEFIYEVASKHVQIKALGEEVQITASYDESSDTDRWIQLSFEDIPEVVKVLESLYKEKKEIFN